jgi:hypothetical protein
MSYASVLADIQAQIIANGTNNITGDVLRPILEDVLGYSEQQTGTLSALNTTSKNNLVEALNEVQNSSSQVNTVDDVASIIAPASRKIIDVLGYSSPNDGGGGLFYWDSTSTETVVSGMILEAPAIVTGRWKRIYSGDLDVRWFGAVADGVTDATQAINRAVDFIERVGYIAGWGQATVLFPKGIILVNGTITTSSAIGLTFKGVSQYGTVIKVTSDDEVLFDLDIYINANFQDMTIAHDTASLLGTWTNTAFQLDGVGGGRMFTLNRVTTIGFDTVIKDVSTVNGDTNNHKDCTFKDCNTFLDSENTQGIINTYINCTWEGAINHVWHVAGHWQTTCISGNIVIDGCTITYKNISAKYNDRGFLFINTKWEYTAAHAVPNSQPKLIDADGNFIQANVKFQECSLIDTVGSYDAATRMIKVIGNSYPRIEIIGGQWGGIFEIEDSTTSQPRRGSYVRFKDCRLMDIDNFVYTETAAGGRSIPAIEFDNVYQNETDNKMPYNFVKTGIRPSNLNVTRTNVIADPSSTNQTYVANNTYDYEIEFLGQNVMLESLIWSHKFGNAVSGAQRVVDVYSDSGRTALIVSFNIPNNATTGSAYQIAVPADTVVSGIYITITTPTGAATHRGHLTATYTSI